MSLAGALYTAQSALSTQQAALQVTGNNISNAGNADYSRQLANTAPAPDQQIRTGIFIGTGVDLTSIQRQVDEALNGRLRGAVSDSAMATTNQQWLSQVESTINPLTGTSLGTQLDTFFNDWSTLANSPTNNAQRQVVIQDGINLSQTFQSLQTKLGSLQGNIGQEMSSQAKAADGLAQEIAGLNVKISVSEGGTAGQANGLRDQRDADLKQLSQLMNVSTQEQPNGSINVYVGSEVLVDGQTNRGVAVTNKPDANGNLTPTFTFKANNGTIPIASGQLAGLTNSQTQIKTVTSQIDTVAHNLIFELNKVHSSGQGMVGYSSVTATSTISDATVPLNQATTGLKFTPTNGSFVVHVKDKATGLSTSTLVPVSLTGAAGDTTVNSLLANLNGISGVTANVTAGKLTIATTSSTQEISFSQDSSGALAALGVNSYFTGDNASNIAVNSQISSQPSLLAASGNGDAGNNQTALAIAALSSQSVTALGGQSITETYQTMVNNVGTTTAAAKQNATAAAAVQTTLQTQQSSISGVNMDEEAVNLMQQQRAFQAAAQVVTAVNSMMQTIIQMI